MTDKDGGPAFPIAAYTLGLDGKPMLMVKDGMTLRAYLAAKAMQGMMARDTFDQGQDSPPKRARLACLEADALIAELAK